MRQGRFKDGYELDMELGEDQALVRTLRSGGTASPQFREALRAQFAEAAAQDARRRSVQRKRFLSISMPSRGRLAVAAAAVVIVAVSLGTMIGIRHLDGVQVANGTAPDGVVNLDVVSPSESLDSLDSHIGANADGMDKLASAMKDSDNSRSLGFGPKLASEPTTILLRSGDPLSDKVEAKIRDIAADAGGSYATDDGSAVRMASPGATGVVVTLNVNKDTVDHVLGQLAAAIPSMEAIEEPEVTTADVLIRITFAEPGHAADPGSR